MIFEAFALDGARRAVGAVPLLDARSPGWAYAALDFSCTGCRRRQVCTRHTNGLCLDCRAPVSEWDDATWRALSRRHAEQKRWADYHRRRLIEQQARARRAVRYA